jgi:CRP-like cAMP-binding protein
MIEEKLFEDAKKSAINSLPLLFQKSFANAEMFELNAQNNLNNSENLYVLLSGFLYIEDSSKNCVRFLQNGDVLFTEKILSPSISTYNFVALSDCVFLQISLEKIRSDVHANPLYHLDILNVVTKSLQVMDELSANKITLPLKYQLAKFIQLLNKQITFYNYPIIPVGKNLIQNYLSCSTSNINKLITELENQKIISFVGKGFCVKNSKLLDKLLA